MRDSVRSFKNDYFIRRVKIFSIYLMIFFIIENLSFFGDKDN